MATLLPLIRFAGPDATQRPREATALAQALVAVLLAGLLLESALFNTNCTFLACLFGSGFGFGSQLILLCLFGLQAALHNFIQSCLRFWQEDYIGHCDVGDCQPIAAGARGNFVVNTALQRISRRTDHRVVEIAVAHADFHRLLHLLLHGGV